MIAKQKQISLDRWKRLHEAARVPVLSIDDVLHFGEFKGCTIRQVVNEYDPQYIHWCIKEKLFDLDRVSYNYYVRELNKLLAMMKWYDNNGKEINPPLETERKIKDVERKTF